MLFKSKYPDVVPASKYNLSLADFFWQKLDDWSEKSLFVDYVSARQWTGAQIKLKATQVARVLVERLKIPPSSCCLFYAINNDYLQLAAIGAIFAGCSVFVCAPGEPKTNLVYMTSQLKPRVVFISTEQDFETVIGLILSKQIDGSQLTVCLLDSHNQVPETLINNNIPHLRLHADIWDIESSAPQNASASANQLQFRPVRVEPHWPAYILYTSGSTGPPKPVARTHKNCLYVAHCLDSTNDELWDLGPSSVMAGHLQLDHGTGTFSLKMCLSKGYKLIIMDGYEYKQMLDAIVKYQITDVMLGSALLHQFITTLTDECQQQQQQELSCLRNLIAIGSPIASHKATASFMDKYPSVSVRQAFGMTECGFISLVPASECRQDTESVGYLLPNLELRLVSRTIELERKEQSAQRLAGEPIVEANVRGELQVRGPTVTPGYLGDQFERDSRQFFLDDGFYRSNDLAFVTPERKLVICGRFSDVLCLYDGWKVLPQDIERALAEHEGVHEVGVIGIPHPELPTCDAPRAYVVPKAEWACRLTAPELAQFARTNLSVYKQLEGGIVILSPDERLPRGSLQKLDRKQLLARYKAESRLLSVA